MNGISDYLAQKYLDFVYGDGTWTKPSSLTLHLYKNDPGPDDSGDEVSDTVDDTAYAAQTITYDSVPTADASIGYLIKNDATETFAAVVYGSGAAAYDVSHWGVKDNSGNLLDYGPLPTTITREAGKTLVFNIGDIVHKAHRSL